ncbi:hypothetical protein M8C21_006320 [Ambrosia artemisiifolia]|uniref:DUF4378 domain-containing protein n=1 Tax=Ambrosia artemisiifolia TaxID=4212 RepID=A0AAD5GGF9_AMBAR|nr:hypothetical protein M8C21_006320 [Ambrosia artemisiifolia]
MARKSPKCPSTVEPKVGCVWSFGGMFDFDHYHGGHHQKLLLDESHQSKSLSRAEHERGQVKMLTFDEQLRSIYINSKKKAASVNQSLKKEEAWKKTVEKCFWRKMKTRYENMSKKKENTNVIDTIVVLKPSRRVMDCPVDVGCRCLHSHPHHSSASKKHMVKHSHVLFNDVRKKLKISKLKSLRKMKSCGETDETGFKAGTLSLVPYTKHQEPEVFMEARRHLAERLRLVALGTSVGEPSGSSCKQVARTLERILRTSPIHESMAALEREMERTHGEKSLHTTWSALSPLKQNEYSSSSGFLEITNTNDFLSRGSKFRDSDPNNIGPSPQGTNGCIEGPQQDLLLDVTSPKSGCKPENMDNDQYRENPSPVSVLDPFFSDSFDSPTSTIETGEQQMQPRRLDFEEQSSRTSSPPQKFGASFFPEDREFISSYVKELYQASESNWEDFLSTDYAFESPCDVKVLHDCVREVLVSLHTRMMLFSTRVQPFSLEKDVINKVIDQVDWHNGQPVGPRTLDQLIRMDMAKFGSWLDTLSERNDIMVEAADDILHDLVIEASIDICF